MPRHVGLWKGNAVFWRRLAPLALSLALCVPMAAPHVPSQSHVAPRGLVRPSFGATTLILPHGTEHIDSRALAGWGRLLPSSAYLSGYRVHYQQRQLSCEAAAVSMATDGALTEQQVVAAMPISDNPWLGFRGNLDRPETLANGLQDYGILAPPMARAVQSLGYDTRVVIGPAAPQLLRYAIAVLHRPVVVWVTWRLEDWPTIVGHADGKSFTLVLHEHANTVIGYDQGGVWVLDPWDGGPLYRPWATFLHVWLTYFHGMSLLLAPRFRAPSLRDLKARVVGRYGVWSWAGALPGSVATVTLYRAGWAVRTVTLPPFASRRHRQSVRFPLTHNAPYTVRVREVAPLAIAAPPLKSTHALTLIRPRPTMTPTATPTAIPTTTPTVTPTATPFVGRLNGLLNPTPQPTSTPHAGVEHG